MRATLAVAALTAVLTGSAAPAAAQKVGVVDLLRLYQNCKMAEEMMADLEAQRQEMEREIDDHQKRINEMTNLRELDFKAGSPEALRLTEDILKLEFDLEAYRGYKTQYLLLRHMQYTQQIYNAILREIRDYARENGFELILSLDPLNLEGSRSPQESVARIAQKKVLYRAESIDLTEIILHRLDQRSQGEN